MQTCLRIFKLSKSKHLKGRSRECVYPSVCNTFLLNVWPKAPDLMRARCVLGVQGPKAPQKPSDLKDFSFSKKEVFFLLLPTCLHSSKRASNQLQFVWLKVISMKEGAEL